MLQAQRHDRGLSDNSGVFAGRAIKELRGERSALAARLVKALPEREYLMACGRIQQLDDTIAQLEELYRKYIQDDEDEEDE